MVEAQVLRTGLCHLHVCVPCRWTDDEIALWANQAAPTGISSRWQVYTKPGDHRYVKCNEHPGAKKHCLMVC